MDDAQKQEAQQKLTDTQNKINDLKDQASTAGESEKAGILEQIKNLEAEKDSLTQKVQGYEADATKLEGEAKTAETDAQNLETEGEGVLKDLHL